MPRDAASTTTAAIDAPKLNRNSLVRVSAGTLIACTRSDPLRGTKLCVTNSLNVVCATSLY